MLELAHLGEVGVPPPRKTVSTASARTSIEPELREERVDVGAVLPRRPTTVTKSQYPHRCAQNGRWT